MTEIKHWVELFFGSIHVHRQYYYIVSANRVETKLIFCSESHTESVGAR